MRKNRLLITLALLLSNFVLIFSSEVKNQKKENNEIKAEIAKKCLIQKQLLHLDITSLPLDLKCLINEYLNTFKLINEIEFDEIDKYSISKCGRYFYHLKQEIISPIYGYITSSMHTDLTIFELFDLVTGKKVEKSIFNELVPEILDLSFQFKVRLINRSEICKCAFYGLKLKFKSKQFNDLINALFEVPPIQYVISDSIFKSNRIGFINKDHEFSPNKNFLVTKDGHNFIVTDTEKRELIRVSAQKVLFSPNDKFMMCFNQSNSKLQIYMNEAFFENSEKEIDEKIRNISELKKTDAQIIGSICIKISSAVIKGIKLKHIFMLGALCMIYLSFLYSGK